MVICAKDYASQLCDSNGERELGAELRKLPEADRLRFIYELMEIPHCFGIAMRLVKTCLKERQSLEAVLTQGLERGDASTVKHWLEAVVHGLGFQRVVRLISDRITTDPASVIKAEYHLRKWIPADDQKGADAFAALHKAVQQIILEDPTIEKKTRPFKVLIQSPE